MQTLVCVLHTVYICIREYVNSHVSVYVWALFKLRVFNSSVCGFVFLFRRMQSGEVSASAAAGYQ